jgi:ABC-type glycerol-3-phosphate transport system permease component
MLEMLVHGLEFGVSAFQLPEFAAMYLLFIAPGLAAFAIVQRWFMKGLIEGALSA